MTAHEVYVLRLLLSTRYCSAPHPRTQSTPPAAAGRAYYVTSHVARGNTLAAREYGLGVSVDLVATLPHA